VIKRVTFESLFERISGRKTVSESVVTDGVTNRLGIYQSATDCAGETEQYRSHLYSLLCRE